MLPDVRGAAPLGRTTAEEAWPRPGRPRKNARASGWVFAYRRFTTVWRTNRLAESSSRAFRTITYELTARTPVATPTARTNAIATRRRNRVGATAPALTPVPAGSRRPARS